MMSSRQRALWLAVVAGVAACVALAGLAATSLAGGVIASPPASGRYAVKPAPFGGVNIGGSMTVAPGGKAISSLKFRFPASWRDVCGASVQVVGKLALHNLTGTNRYRIHISDWFFGRWRNPDANMDPKRVTLQAGGRRVSGRLSLVFIHTSARVPSGVKQPDGGQISFTLPDVGGPCGATFAVARRSGS